MDHIEITRPTVEDEEFKRHSTDVICFILLILYLVMMIIITIIGILNTEGKMYFVPSDSNGTKCGHGSMSLKPVLLIYDFRKCIPSNFSDVEKRLLVGRFCLTPQICLSECPKQYKVQPNGNFDSSEYPYCYDESVLNAQTNLQEIKKSCAPAVLPSTSVFDICIPLQILANQNTESLQTTDLDKIKEGIIEFSKLLGLKQFFIDLSESFMRIKYWFILYFFVILAISFIFICFIRYFNFLLIILLCLLCTGSCLFGLYGSISLYRDPEAFTNSSIKDNQIYQFIRTKVDFKEKNVVLGACIVFGIASLVSLIMSGMVLMNLKLITFLMTYVSRVLSKDISVFLFPPFVAVVQILSFAWLIGGVWLLVSSDKMRMNLVDYDLKKIECQIGRIYTNGTCQLFNKTKEYTYAILLALFVFGWLWFYVYSLGLISTTIALNIASSFWSPRHKVSSILKSFLLTFFYHSGSIAFGSLIMAILYILRITFEALQKKLKDKTKNAATEKVIGCLGTCLTSVTFFFNSLNKRAFILVAVTSSGFCVSAGKALVIFLNYPMKYFSILFSVKLVMILGRVSVSLFSGVTIYYHLTYLRLLEHRITFSIIFAVIAFFYFSAILEYYDIGIETVFFCLNHDKEKYDCAHTPEDMRRVLHS